MREGQVEKAKEGIDSFLDLIVRRSQKGIADRDIYMRNFGFIDNCAIEIDIGPFVKDPHMQEKETLCKELFLATDELRGALQKYPELLSYLQTQLAERTGRENVEAL
jgi:hypothetical protein